MKSWAFKDCILANWKSLMMAFLLTYVMYSNASRIPVGRELIGALSGLTFAALLSYGLLNARSSGVLQYFSVGLGSFRRVIAELLLAYSSVAAISSFFMTRSLEAALSALFAMPAFAISILLLPEWLGRITPIALILGIEYIMKELSMINLMTAELCTSAIAILLTLLPQAEEFANK
ncbi:hypothetical protein IPA_01280 [Ignicoccus pacificus DSM 13166]|uniref:Uncharacterized protein n=1 Tax=Ignicoccus pacificus DSM 13166 TaxID=940294 RepID=A0A977PL85_9CREN|nr:hypothetical protein IPA_01280 [Ignicoccus pacificus DSM 13166]